MNKQAPTFARLAAMTIFALSCFGLLLFLWLAFGGPIPLKPEGYRFKTSFSEATQLAEEADVRISGVPVGTVKSIESDRKTGRSIAEIEIDSEYAPVPSDAKAVLRQKTLLGETYVELTPGTPTAPKIPEDGTLRASQVSDTVELDEIYRSFDARTRAAFQTWMQSQARALDGRGKDINDALGNLGPFAEDAARVVDVLNRQQGALRQTVANTGVVFEALTEREGQLRELIRNSNSVFETLGANDRRLQETFTALPAFERESRATVRRVTEFARETDPLVTQLRPAARELSPAFTDLAAIAPDLRALFEDLGPLITASREGFPAASEVLEDLRPVLAQADPTGRQLVPILSFLGLYKNEINAFLANATAATQAGEVLDEGLVHYLRTTNPLNAENLAAYPRRLGSNRTNPYVQPGGFTNIARKRYLESYETRHCRNGTPRFPDDLVDLSAVVNTGAPNAGEALAQVFTPDPVTGLASDPKFVGRVLQYAFGRTDQSRPVPAPPCEQQEAFNSSGRPTQYPQLRERPPGRP